MRGKSGCRRERKFYDFNDQVNVYLNCAITLSNSLRLKDVEFVLLTNSKFEIERVKPVGTALQIEEIPFSTTVPVGTPFYSAHYKLDAFRYFSGLTESYVALCDVDMVGSVQSFSHICFGLSGTRHWLTR